MQLFNTLILSIVFGLMYWLVPGIVGGAVTALVIKWTDLQLDFERVAAIAFGWVRGMVIGGIIGGTIFVTQTSNTFNYQLPLMVSFCITGMFTALIGSWTTYKVLESVSASSKEAG